MTREEARKHIKERMELYIHSTMDNIALHKALEALGQPERKKGKWKIDWDWGLATCTNCNHDYDDADNGYLLGNEMRYCPFCGANMEGEE